MISIDVSHPDVMEFIKIKSDLSRVTQANISVKVDNSFMSAVKTDGTYELRFVIESTGEIIREEVKARDLFMELVRQNHSMAEPKYWAI